MFEPNSRTKHTAIPVGQSLCLVFESEAEQKEAVYTFLRSGVERGHRMMYLLSETHDASMLDYLRSGQAAEPQGQLRIQWAGKVFASLSLDGTQFANWLRDEARLAREQGFSGLSLAVEMGWAARKYSPLELQAFEMELLQGLAGSQILALTLYDRRLFPPPSLLHILTAHPYVMAGGMCKPNPFHLPTEPAAAAETLQHWLNHLSGEFFPTGFSLEEDARLRIILSSMPMVVFALDRQGKFTLSEGRGLAALGLKPGEVVGKDVKQVFPHLEDVEMWLQRALSGETFSQDINVSGNIFETHCSPLRNSNGEIEGMLGVAVDITEQRQADLALRASEERYRTLVENQGEGAGIFAADGQVLYINGAAEGILGLPVEQIVGQNIADFIPPEERAAFSRQIAERKTGKASTYEIGFMRKDGQRRQVLVTATPRFDPGGIYLGSFSIFRDITDRKRMEDKLRFQSNHDALTGLYNRFYFNQEMKLLNRNRQSPVGFIVVDIDNLKQTNDNLGHLIGDDLLRRLARLLRNTFRFEDIVARIGGDEFAILLPDCDEKALDISIKRLRVNLAGINQQSDQPLQISIGGAVAEVGRSLTKTFDLADQRMYQEKFSRKRKE